MENICKNCQPEALRRSGNSNADRMTLSHRTNNSENRSGKNIVKRRNSDSHIKDYISLDRKRIGKSTGDVCCTSVYTLVKVKLNFTGR